MRVALASQDGKTTYASATFMINGTFRAWNLYNATLSPRETDTAAKLTITFEVRKAYFPSRFCLTQSGLTKNCMNCHGCLSVSGSYAPFRQLRRYDSHAEKKWNPSDLDACMSLMWGEFKRCRPEMSIILQRRAQESC